MPVTLDGWLAFAALAHLASVSVLVFERRFARDGIGMMISGLVAVAAGAGGTVWATGSVWVVVPATVALGATVGLLSRFRGLRPSGRVVWATFLVLSAVSAAWGAVFLLSLGLSVPTMATLWLAAVLVAVTLPPSIVQTYEAWEVLLRRDWKRPRAALPGPGVRMPRVSIHVPVHAEPPEVAIATLDRLAALDYPNFEVLVIDNNTADPRLWVPVRDRCEQLGVRFRFFHVEGIEGAKAGALNYALAHTDPNAELIGVVDADYQVRPDWLSRTVGFFADPTMGFVQCPHAYRGFHARRFGRMANLEYRVFFETSMVSYNERGAALTVGTMSLVRRDVLERVGGWATWCLTEDSELSIRIHALGCNSVYLNEPFGRGLIPDTFADYKKQRFRWTYGPVQELRHHLRLFLPGRAGRRSALTLTQRVHHGNHGLDVALIGVRFCALPVTACAALSMVIHHEVVPVPLALWIAATSLVLSSLAMRWFVYRAVVRATLAQAVGAVIAYLALGHAIHMASLRALFARPATWQRTNKFPSRSGMRGALRAARTETILALSSLTFAAVGLAVLPERGLATMLLIGLALLGLTYLSAPAVALIADHDLRSRTTRPRAMALTLEPAHAPAMDMAGASAAVGPSSPTRR